MNTSLRPKATNKSSKRWLSARQRRGFSPKLQRATWSRPNQGIILNLLLFKFFWLGATASRANAHLRLFYRCRKGKNVDLRPPQVDILDKKSVKNKSPEIWTWPLMFNFLPDFVVTLWGGISWLKLFHRRAPRECITQLKNRGVHHDEIRRIHISRFLTSGIEPEPRGSQSSR